LVISLTLKFRVAFNNIYTITVCGFLPTVLLLAAGTFYYRILTENPEFVVIGLVLAGALYLLSFYRILKGTYTIFDASPFKTYFYGISTAVIIIGFVWYYVNSTRYLFDFYKLVAGFLKY